MKVKVLSNVIDKVSGNHYSKGDVIELSEDRAKTAINLGLVKAIKKEKVEGKPNTSKKEK